MFVPVPLLENVGSFVIESHLPVGAELNGSLQWLFVEGRDSHALPLSKTLGHFCPGLVS